MKSAIAKSPAVGLQSPLWGLSELTFQMGLALITFEQVRPFFGIQVSDYFFILSLLLFLPGSKTRLQEVRGSGILMAGLFILSGALLSLRNASNLSIAMGPLIRLFVLFGLFAPLSLVHSENIRKNMLYLMGGIFINSTLALLQAWVFPGIVNALSINPARPDISEESGRLQSLTSHPNVLGLSAALAALIAALLLLSNSSRQIRGRLVSVVVVCTIAGLLSGSRTFLVALVAGLLVFMLSQKLHRKAVAGTILTLAVLWGGLNYVAPNVLTAYSERLGSSGESFAPDESRYMAAGLALLEISQKPLLGWGPDHLDDAGFWLNPETGELAGVHNSFLMYWHGAGLLGAIGFLAVFLIPVWRAVQLLKKPLLPKAADDIRLALACYGFLFVVSNLQPILYNRFLFVPVFVFAGFAARLWRPGQIQPAAGGRRPAAQLGTNLRTAS